MITGYFGLPGCGKTTFLAMLAQKELRRIAAGKSKYKFVMTNFYCAGCVQFDYAQLGHYHIEDALILIDEITLDADSRDFKQFDKAHKMFFLLHRHYGIDVVYFTQMYDNVDKKIRDVTYNLFFVRKLGCFSVAKVIYRTLDINEQTKDIVNGYRFPGLIERILPFIKTSYWCFRPRWYKYFDSWDVPDQLPHRPWLDWPTPVSAAKPNPAGLLSRLRACFKRSKKK